MSEQEVLASPERRRALRWTTVLGGVVVVGALVVGAVVAQDTNRPGSADPPAQPPPTQTLAPADLPGTPAGSPVIRAALDGEWRTAPLTRAEVTGTLRWAGLAEYSAYAATLPPGRFRIHLTVYAERSVLTVRGRQRVVGILRVKGHRVTVEPLPPNLGFSHFRWSQAGRGMSLAFTGTSLAKHEGSAGSIDQVALFTAAPFIRS